MSKLLIIIVEIPSPGISSLEPDAPSKWLEFSKESDAIPMPPEGLVKPARNVWIFPAEGTDIFASALKSLARKHQFSVSSYFVSGDVTRMM